MGSINSKIDSESAAEFTMIHLAELRVGESARILDVCPDDNGYQQRLFALGLIPGAEFTVTHIAPLGDPVLLQTRFGIISIRKKEAHQLQIERVTKDL